MAEGRHELRRAGIDIVVIGILVAAALLFIGTGGAAIMQIMASWLGRGGDPNRLLVTAMLLNIALLLFGWRRYRDVVTEVKQRQHSEAEAKRLADTDPLTGLLNRRGLLAALTRFSGPEHFAALMLDLDNFKHINDIHGHDVGDRLLVAVAERLRGATSANCILARMGGDEFACLLPFDPHAPEELDLLAERLIAAVIQPVDYNGAPLSVSVSIGIATGERQQFMQGPDGDHASSGALLHRADIAMFHAKKRRNNRHAWFEPRMESELRLRSELETGIRRGIAQGEFVPYYQQQIDLSTGELVGFEMLARWHSPDLGTVSPDIFIPLAEEMDVIADLSEMLMMQAFRDALQWAPNLTLSVNISPVQLRDPWFAQKLLRMLVDAGFPPSRLDVEITESCVHDNLGAVRSIVTSLKNQGIRISLDDFGTGYSSLHQLRSLPFDQLKIDRSFVTELAEEGSSLRLVEAIVSLGRGLDMPVIAEGIETEAVGEMLKSMGEIKGQGFLYGRPQDARATLDWLAMRPPPFIGIEPGNGVDGIADAAPGFPHLADHAARKAAS